MKDIGKWIHDELFNQVPISIGVMDRNLRIVEANRTFVHNYGPWRNRSCFTVYKGRSERCERCPALDCFRDGQVRINEEEGVLRDEKPTYYLVHMVPLVRDDGEIPYIVEMSTDVTVTKLLEKEKLEAERLAAVGQTVAGLAHGIKNILMGLDGGMYVVRTGLENGNADRIIKGWQMLEENISRITSFAKEFLEFAKGRTPKVSLVDPNVLARKVIDLFRHTARLAGTQLAAQLQEEIPPAPLDEEAIHVCLSNLVSNALDACEASDLPNRRIVLSTRDRDGVLVFEVADDGIGIDYDIQKKVFTSFVSTKDVAKGTGLGLLTTRKIVQEHGGKVSFESTEGAGSVFRLEFPRARLPRPAGADGQHNEPGPAAAGTDAMRNWHATSP